MDNPVFAYTFALVTLLIIPLIVFSVMTFQKMKKLEGAAANNEMMLALINSMKQELSESGHRSRVELQQRLDSITGFLSRSQQENSQNMQNQFRQSAAIIKEVTERLTKIDETNRQVLDFSKQMQSLENILKNPKQRGILGEYFLETLLGNVLQPDQYKMQYSFRDGEIVDAAIFYRDKVIPVDAKFSLEKYNRLMQETDPDLRSQIEKDFKSDVKRRIDETSKYIKPAEDTTDFAFMFIPAEGVYYNLLVYNVGSVNISTQDLVEYAFSKHVIIVSPTSFYAYLETVLQGLKQQKVEENIKIIINRIRELNKHLNNYEEFMDRVGRNLSTTVNSWNAASKEFKKVDRDIYRITEGEAGGGFEPLLIDKPAEE
ncbi:MAG TPA: DNA recombination protein RmuC [Spirochaetota bacterium]|nr:DNA recombination protein RmuC [Spirochaetota bacterium]HPF05428.1 DNA recombination protein RmuC [Spirochaetota bacterium]HPJ41569.1 DNA recombination protein RmuC [Spirochaetota bacterium]HRX48186.1 DNA recombination protein RmuC [Spirochaetota bacterium]